MAPWGRCFAFLDRLFYSTHFDKTMKVGAAVVVSRRGGSSSTFDEVNKYFSISGMPIAPSQYWNMVYGLEHVVDINNEPEDYVCPLCGQPKAASKPAN